MRQLDILEFGVFVIIKNYSKLATTELRKQALNIIEAGINAVLPMNLMKPIIKYNPNSKMLTIKNNDYDLSSGRLFIIGGGKAAGRMVEALESIIPPDNIEAGIVTCNANDFETRKIEIIKAGHPIPDKRGVAGVKQMLAMKDDYSIDKHDLIICLISGGGSSLMPYPVNGVSIEDKQKITDLLIKCGAEIREINIVRKHISRIKGGQLGKYFSPTPVISLIISDVVGNDLAAIASGPTTYDSATFKDSYNILKKYNLLKEAPTSITKFLEMNLNNKLINRPEQLNNCENHIIGTNQNALKAMEKSAADHGFNPTIITTQQKGNPQDIAQQRADEILTRKFGEHDVILLGGETTPDLPKNHGIGGRNQHYAAYSILAMKGYPGEWVVASVATDGVDFIPEIAGAIVDNKSLETANSKNYDIQSFIEKYDSYPLLGALGNSLIKIGDSGTNVGDIIIYILGKDNKT